MKQNLPKSILSLYFIVLSYFAYSQSGGVSINKTNSVAHPSALLDVSSTTAPYMGVLIPRMSTANRNAIISPATGLLVFNTDCGITEYYTGTCWLSMNKGLRSPNPISCSGSTDMCGFETRTFTIATVPGATDYQWTVPPGAIITSGQGNTSVSVTLGNRSGNVCVKAGNVCETSEPQCVEIYINAVPPFTATNNGPICSGETLSLSASNISGATFQWSGPNGFSSSVQNPSISNAAASAGGSYSVVATLNGCASLQITTVAIVNAIPITPVITATPNPACIGDMLNLSTSLVSGASYSWTGPNSFSATTQTPTISNVQTNQAGTYNVTNTVNGCISATGSAAVTVNTIPASTFTPLSGTPNNAITFNPDVSGATYSWTFTSGSPGTSTAQNPSVTWASSGSYNVTLTVTLNGCSSSTTTSVTIIYVPTIVSFTNVGTTTWTPPPGVTSVEFLVVAGGGGGGGANTGGGGGAGGFRTGTIAVSGAITVTVGAGGAGGNSSNNGANGGNSVFGSISATGGGGGGQQNTNGSSGGSGGGGGGGGAGPTWAGGSGNLGSYFPVEGYAGGSSPSISNYGAGGGGGSGGVGVDGNGSAGGNGGAGTLSSISGAPVIYAGGGGGGIQGGIAGNGGSGGGGAGTSTSTAGTAGTPNTGGGGGGCGYNGNPTFDNSSASGGSGIVIIKY